LDDTAPGKPTITIKSGEDEYINNSESSVNLEISSPGMVAGDTIQLKNGSSDLGTEYTVTAADITAGKATIAVAKTDLGTDGAKEVTAVVTDTSGNASDASDATTITLDTTAPSKPTIAIKSGEDAIVNSSETTINLEISSTGMVEGDKIQLKLGTANLGTEYTVTAADITAGKATIAVAKTDLG
ncbi:hypothetical protein, partial [Poseidonibacter ostreae]